MKKFINTEAFDKMPAHEKKLVIYVFSSFLLNIVFCDFGVRYKNVYLLIIAALFLGGAVGMLLIGKMLLKKIRELENVKPDNE